MRVVMRVLTALLVVTAIASATTNHSQDGSFTHDHNVTSEDISIDDLENVHVPFPLMALASTGASVRPGWLQHSSVLGALTSSVHSTLDSGDGLVDGVVVRIAPRFVVTATSLLSARGIMRLQNMSIASRAVVFGTGEARVTRVVFESDVTGVSNDTLIVLELDEEPTKAPLVPVVTSKPNKDFEYEQLQLIHVQDLLDTKVLVKTSLPGRVATNDPKTESKLTFFVEPMCGYKIPEIDDSKSIRQLCVGQLTRPTGTSLFDTGSWHGHRELAPFLNTTHISPNPLGSFDVGHIRDPFISKNDTKGVVGGLLLPPRHVESTPSQRTQIVIPAILLYNGELVGLSIPVLTTDKRFQFDQDNKRGFVRLAAPAHRAFLDQATNQTTRYEIDDVFSKLSKYPSYLATFLDSKGQNVPCQGVLIASKYVLTTASCLKTNTNITAVQFFASDVTDRVTVPVVPSHMAIHPRYTEGDATFDTAVIALAREVTYAPIQLDDGTVDNNASFARIQVANNQCVISATIASSNFDQCQGPIGRKIRSSEAFCVLPVAPTEATTSFSVQEFVGDDSIATLSAPSSATAGAALVTVTRLSSIALVGLAVPASTNSSIVSSHRELSTDGEVYVRVANSATFINAYVAGTSWSISRMEIFETSDVQLPQGEQFVVGLRTTKDGQNYCGGSLIGPTSVLTAAHCVVDYPAHFVSIGAFNSSGVDAEVIAVVASKTQIHNHYGKPHQFSYDVAILELEYPSAVDPVTLDNTSDFTTREMATMYGYGMSSATSGLSPTLRAVQMPLWSREACQQVFGDEIDDSMLCAGGEKGKDACTGDSGSPLVINKGGKSVLVGVVSAGSGCGLANVPGVYARISSVGDFVSTHALGVEWGTQGSRSDVEKGKSSTGSLHASSSGATTQEPASIEARENSMDEPPTTKPSNAPTTISPTTGRFNQVKLALTDLMDLVRTSLMEFLVDDGSEQIMDTALTDAMKSSNNILQFYSTGDLSPLLGVITRHNQLQLNRRRDRFNRWRDSYANESNNVCTTA